MHKKPFIYCISYLPQKKFNELEKYQRPYFEHDPLYLFLENEFSVSTINNIQLSGATLADKSISKILNVKVGHPLLLLEMLALTHKNKPYEYRVSYCLTDRKKLKRIIL